MQTNPCTPRFPGQSEEQLNYKLLLIGNSNVGKTSLLLRYTEDVFLGDHEPTIGIDFKLKSETYKSHNVCLNLFDSAGQERFLSLTKSFYRGAHGIMLMFDICNEESFTALDNWIEVVRELADEAKLMIVGTKADLVEERVVSRERAEKYAQNLNIPYCETSSKGHVNVMEAFMTIVSKLVDSHTEYMLKNSVCMSPMSMGAVSVSSSSNHTQLAGCCKLG